MKTSEEVERDRDGGQLLILRNKRPDEAEDFPARIRIFLDRELRDRAEAPEKVRKGVP
jgi:hypothetical protein